MKFCRFIGYSFFIVVVWNISVSTPVCSAQTYVPPAVNVSFVTDEAEAVLVILKNRKANQPITETDWQRVFKSEGYVRLKKRETAMKNSFEDADFKTFVISDGLLERARALEETLDRWKRADISGAARLALAYLPKQAQIKAKIYPVIKPRDNSFVFDVKTDAAIFVYLDPAVSREKFQNTLAHELHHIGYSTACPTKKASDEISGLPTNKQTVMKLVGAFGEGFAMLAAAGGPDTHPHAVSSSEERERWDKDMANFNDDLKKVEKFFLDVLENRLSDEEARKTYFSFFGVQGPWYTVGWKMSVLIEKTFGRKKLIECICDQRKLLPLYNKAAAKHNRKSRESLALWSESLIKIFSNIQAQEPGNPSVKKPALRRELLKRVEQDQAIRNELISKSAENPDKALLTRMQAIDTANTKRMKAIVSQYGWPGSELVGRDGSEAAFLLVQHADLGFQKEMLPLVEKAYRGGGLSGQSSTTCSGYLNEGGHSGTTAF